MMDFRWGSGRQPVRLIGVNAPFQPRLQFGHEFGSGSDKRNTTFEQNHDVSQMSARGEVNQTIKQPAPQREQTILSHRLSPDLKRQLQSGFSSPQNNGRNQAKHFPRIEHIQIASYSQVQQRNTHVTKAQTSESKMDLRVIASSF